MNFDINYFSNVAVFVLFLISIFVSIINSARSLKVSSETYDINISKNRAIRLNSRLITIIPAIIVLLSGTIYFIFSQNSSSNNQISQNSISISCTRDKPYEMPPEFIRAISLIDQRSSKYIEAAYRLKNDDLDSQFDQLFVQQQASMNDAAYHTDPMIILNYGLRHISNCLDIKYDNKFSNIEGYFSFSNNNNVTDLKIGVSSAYENNDDLLTAFLLTHEITHAINYYINHSDASFNSSTGCLNDETWAYTSQIFFLATLNTSELDSISSRLKSSQAKELNFTKDLVDSTVSKDNNWQNWLDIYAKVKTYVNTSPTYIDLCQTQMQ